MAQKVDSKEVVTAEEITNSNMFQIEALLRLLVKKGVITQQKYIEELKGLKIEMAKKRAVK